MGELQTVHPFLNPGCAWFPKCGERFIEAADGKSEQDLRLENFKLTAEPLDANQMWLRHDENLVALFKQATQGCHGSFEVEWADVVGGRKHDPAIVFLRPRRIWFQPLGGPFGAGGNLISPEGVATGITITAIVGTAGADVDAGLGPFGYAEFGAC